MKTNCPRTAKRLSLSLATSLAVIGLAHAGHIIDDGPVVGGPDVVPVHVTTTGNAATCAAPGGGGAGLEYPLGIKVDVGSITGTWHIVVGAGRLVTLTQADFTPPGTTKVGEIQMEYQGNRVAFSSTLPILATILKGANDTTVYAYEAPPSKPSWWPNPDTIAYPGRQLIDDGLETKPGATASNLSHIELCFDLSLNVSKTADTSYTRTWEWAIDKRVDPDQATVFYGDSHDFDYEVEVTKVDYEDSDFAVSGEILIQNPHPTLAATVTSVTDVISRMGEANINASVDCGVALPFQIAAGGSRSCSYSADLPDAEDRLNTATVVSTGVPGGQGNADVGFGDPTTVVNGSVTVNDTLEGELGTISDSFTFTYSIEAACTDDAREDGDRVELANTAEIEETGQDASADATLYCADFEADKTASGRFDRTYEWDPAKFVVLGADRSPSEQQLADEVCMQLDEADFPGYGGRWACPDAPHVLGSGADLEPVYLASLLRDDNTDADGNFVVEGWVEYSFPDSLTGKFSLAGLVDTLSFDDASADVDVPVNAPAECDVSVVGGIRSIRCDYSQSVPRTELSNGVYAGGTNTVDVTREAKCYDANGEAKAECGLSDVTESASADFGFALDGETHACVHVLDLFDGAAIEDAIDLIIGADENGLYCGSVSFIIDEAAFGEGESPFVVSYADLVERIDEACHVEVPNQLLLVSDDDDETSWGSNLAVLTVELPDECGQQGCTYTRGYWQTHSVCGPASGANSTWDTFLIDPGLDKSSVDCRRRDNATVYQLFDGIAGQSWLDVLWIPPQGGNAYYILSAQYVAAKLNILAGADSTPQVDAAIQFAETFFANHTPTSAGNLKGAARNAAIQAASTLDSYNNGNIGPGHCD